MARFQAFLVLAQQPFDITRPLQGHGRRQSDLRATVDEDLSHRLCADEGGVVERREPSFIERFGVGTELQQSRKRIRLVLDHGQMQRHTPFVGQVHPFVEIGARLRDEQSNGLDVTHRHGGKDVVFRPVGDQIVDHFLICFQVVETCCPSDDVELVVITLCNGFCAVFDEETDDPQVLFLGRKVQRRCRITLVSYIRVGAAFQQASHDSFMGRVHRVVESGSQPRMAGERATLVDDVGMAVEQFADSCCITIVGGVEESLDRRFARCAASRRMVFSHLLLEARPILESMLGREGMLNIAQSWFRRRLRIGSNQTGAGVFVAGAYSFKPALRFFLEAFERCRSGELAGHGPFLREIA
jgi:hypothetical protein